MQRAMKFYLLRGQPLGRDNARSPTSFRLTYAGSKCTLRADWSRPGVATDHRKDEPPLSDAGSRDRNALHLNLPHRIAETANDERAGRPVRAEDRRAASTHCDSIRRIAHNGGDFHQVRNLLPSGTQLRLQIAPCQRALCLSITGDTAIGSDTYLAAEVKRPGGSCHFDGLRVLAGRCRCVGSFTPKALAARLKVAPQTGTALLRALGRGWSER